MGPSLAPMRMPAPPATHHPRRRHGRGLASDATSRRPTVVLVLDDHSPPSCAITRAARAAHALRAELHVVVALSLSGGDDDRDESASLVRIVDRIRQLAPAHRVDIEFRAGEVQRLAIEIGNARRAELMVVTPDTGMDGARAVAIANALDTPVLVARGIPTDGPIVAATDLVHLQYPVLAASRWLGRALHKPITYLHNAAPSSWFTFNPMVSVTPYFDTTGLVDAAPLAQLGHLRTLAGADDDVDVIVTRAHATLDAILQAAHDRDADLVTIGHRARSWFTRAFGHSLAERVVDHWQGSALIVPVEGR